MSKKYLLYNDLFVDIDCITHIKVVGVNCSVYYGFPSLFLFGVDFEHKAGASFLLHALQYHICCTDENDAAAISDNCIFVEQLVDSAKFVDEAFKEDEALTSALKEAEAEVKDEK